MLRKFLLFLFFQFDILAVSQSLGQSGDIQALCILLQIADNLEAQDGVEEAPWQCAKEFLSG